MAKTKNATYRFSEGFKADIAAIKSALGLRTDTAAIESAVHQFALAKGIVNDAPKSLDDIMRERRHENPTA